MLSKKSASKKSKRKRASQQGKVIAARLSKIWGGADVLPLIKTGNGKGNKQPSSFKPETEEEREKRLAARKELTLKAARIAYENYHQRKAS